MFVSAEYVPPTGSDAIYQPPPACDGPYAQRLYVDCTVPASLLHPSVDNGGPAKVSHCPLEIDLPASALLNRRDLAPRHLHDSFIEKLSPEEVTTYEKLVRSVQELWDDERRRRSARGETGPTDLKDDAPRVWDSRDPHDPIWRSEADNRKKMREKAEVDLRAFQAKMGAKGRRHPEFETYGEDKEKIEGKKSGWLDCIRTAFEQVDAIYISRFEADERSSYVYGAWAVKGIGMGITAEQEAAWTRSVDVGRLKASAAAVRSATQALRAQAEAAGEDVDFDDDGELDPDCDEATKEDARPPPATQAEALRRTQAVMDRRERRGRQALVGEAEWDEELDDDDDDGNFWGLAGDAASERAPSEASFDMSSVSPESRSIQSAVSVSPVKAPSFGTSPAKRDRSFIKEEGSAESDLNDERARKRVMTQEQDVVHELASCGGAFGQQAASFLYVSSLSSSLVLLCLLTWVHCSVNQERPRPARSARNVSSRTPPHARTPLSTPPSRVAKHSPLKHSPFSNPNRTVQVRAADPSSTPPQAVFSDDDDNSLPLFSFVDAENVAEEKSAGEKDEFQPTPVPPTRPAASLACSAIGSSLEPEFMPSPSRGRSAMTPSQAIAELEDLPEDTFDDDYQPTPTVKEEQPSQLPLHLRSSTGASAIGDASEAKPQPVGSPEESLRELPDSDMETDEDVKSHIPVELEHHPKKRVAFQWASAISSSSLSSSSQANTPTPVASTAESQHADVVLPLSASQTISDSDSTMAVPPRLVSHRSHRHLSRNSYVYTPKPPTVEELESTMENYGSKILYQDPFYSKPSDVPRRSREHGGKRFTLQGSTIKYLKPFRHAGEEPSEAFVATGSSRRMSKVTKWEFAARPPTKAGVEEWLARDGSVMDSKRPRFNPIKSQVSSLVRLFVEDSVDLPLGCQIEGPTQKGDGFKFTPIAGAPSQREKQHMAVLAMELHANTRGNLLPDPQHDAIEAIFYCLQSDNEDLHINGRSENTHVGVIIVGDEILKKKLGSTNYLVEVVEDERQLIDVWIDKVRFEFDPECLAGYEVHHGSWGYLIERAEYYYSWNLVPELGRVKAFDTGKSGNAQSDRWGFNQHTTLDFTGRHVLPIWRILKADNKFQQNSFEHVAYHILRLRTPHYSFAKLTEWFTSGSPRDFARVLGYWRNRVEMDVEMLVAAESARVFGVDFKSVRYRGSQFKVEAVMFKIAKPESFLLLSPNRVQVGLFSSAVQADELLMYLRIQVGRQNAAECMPLIMEPKSAFYKGPLVVLDFQSLYPSVMIAYNYCYSTFLGRVDSFKGTNKFGVMPSLEHPEGLLYLMQDHINVSPNGMMFVKPEVRKSLLAKMLTELLDTRVMVKSSMKSVTNDKVTYGYTSATFSGRMPAVEVADAIVQTGRETLEAVSDVSTIRGNEEWGAEVVYGDTDSLFIYLPGKTVEDAFRIGNEMADTVTSQNPRPIKLKFEKVGPSALLRVHAVTLIFCPSRSTPNPSSSPRSAMSGSKWSVCRTSPSSTRRALRQFDEMESSQRRRCRRLASSTISSVSRLSCKVGGADSPALVQDPLSHGRPLAGQGVLPAPVGKDPRGRSFTARLCHRQSREARYLRVRLARPPPLPISATNFAFEHSEGRLPPPGAAVATRAMVADPRAEPEYGERVPYVMFQSEPGQKQVDRAIAPDEFLADP
ncbi:SPOSA6832_00268 [Sporobolomyces salmonicolor]|uniref:DNA polymerase n=1 Tax=Sporidiobolus salmonicolor TaxID=5005 RepID=A0A0D6EGB6_SPOSA|nr:SPOSA6832_00268 [Sporobolomyces salmonicolor]